MNPKALVVVDIQREYITDGRPFRIRSIESSLANARRILELARKRGWAIYHIRHLQEGSIFTRESEFSDFISGFEPAPDEREIIKGDYSCYSAPEFAQVMKKHLAADEEVAMIGYGSTRCCLSTIIDGYHRGQKFVFVTDASNAVGSSRFGEESLHAHATDIIAIYSRAVSTEEICG